MEDLFGNVIEEPEKTFKEEYAEYIRSPKWRQKAKAALARAGEKCERCGYSKFSRKLEVHHRTYERFRAERPEDLEVVCETCHKEADAKRHNRTLSRQAARLYEARLDGWAAKVWGDDWEDRAGYEYAAERFDDWLERQSEW